MIKVVRYIQLNKIAYLPNLFKAIITYETHSNGYDESDDLEYQKELMNALLKDKWFVTPTKIEDKNFIWKAYGIDFGLILDFWVGDFGVAQKASITLHSKLS
jgi:hypothetical protein